VDFLLAVCLADQKDADATGFGSREWSSEEQEAFFGESVHEVDVLVDARLLVDAAVLPASSCFADATQTSATITAAQAAQRDTGRLRSLGTSGLTGARAGESVSAVEAR